MNIIFHSANNLPIGQRIDTGYISLTDMAKSQDKRLDDWLHLRETDLLLREFEKSTEYQGYEPIITTEGKNGSIWGHPDIAIIFAHWCSLQFALLVARWIRQWLTTNQKSTTTNQYVEYESNRLIKSYIKSSQALNRVIHTAIHQQTNSLREVLESLENSSSLTVLTPHTIQKNSNDNEEKTEDLTDSHTKVAFSDRLLQDSNFNSKKELPKQKAFHSLEKCAASGSLYRYLKNKKLKSGAIASYPAVEGVRDSDNLSHWYWGYSYQVQENGRWKG